LTKKTLIHIKATLKSPPRQYGGPPLSVWQAYSFTLYVSLLRSTLWRF